MDSLRTWLTTPPMKEGVLDPFGAFCLLVLAPGFVVSAYLTGLGADRVAKNPLQLAGIRHWASRGLWVFGAGLFFFAVRAMHINPLTFGQPIWLVVSIVAVVFVAARCVDWWRTVYPAELARRVPMESVHPRSEPSSRVSTAPTRKSIPEMTVRR